MIITEFYREQGFGNQLWMYAVAVSSARELKCDFSILSFKRFKGKKFLKINPGKPIKYRASSRPNPTLPPNIDNYITDANLSINNYADYIRTRSKIEGCFQMEELVIKNRKYLTDIFQVTDKSFSSNLQNTCIINLRGGEYAGEPKLLIPADYYYTSMEIMKSHNPKFEFKVVTDDPNLSKKYFPNIEIMSKPPRRPLFVQVRFPNYKKIKYDFWLIQNAGGLILSNSSFSWWGAWTNTKVSKIIAPMFWGNFNEPSSGWQPPNIFTKGWDFLDINNQIKTKN
jgi:hypothetical protein